MVGLGTACPSGPLLAHRGLNDGVFKAILRLTAADLFAVFPFGKGSNIPTGLPG
jgi:hypothetical protein